MDSLQNYTINTRLGSPPLFERQYLGRPVIASGQMYMYDYEDSYSMRSREPETITGYMAMERARERERDSRDIMDRIMHLHHDFIRRFGITPNSVFLNREDHYQLTRDNHMNYYGDMNTCMGLKVIPTIAEESYVGLVNLEH